MIITRSTVVHCILICAFLLLCGCVAVPHQDVDESPLPKDQTEDVAAPAPQEEQYYTHKIQWPGENLIRISRWYTGSGNNWERILAANPAIDPKRMRIGDVILIPEDLMKTHEPMPKGYRIPVVRLKENNLDTFPVNEAPVSPTDASPGSMEGELFGPVDSGLSTSSPAKTDPPLSLETID